VEGVTTEAAAVVIATIADEAEGGDGEAGTNPTATIDPDTTTTITTTAVVAVVVGAGGVPAIDSVPTRFPSRIRKRRCFARCSRL